MPVAVHTINFRGTSGAIFGCLAAGLVLYVVGFATTGWTISNGGHSGLWEFCSCGKLSLENQKDWFQATRAMITIGLLGLLIAMLCIFLYMCVHSLNKNQIILATAIVCFLSALFMLIGFIIYGAKASGVSWSYALCVIGGIFTLIAGILSVIQMRESGA